MTDTAVTSSPEAQAPVFQIQRVYLKEASLEQPNSPAILLDQQQPSVAFSKSA
jgi:preprotein translocase subunit SecB